MPTTVDNKFYEDIATELESKYKPKLHKYFYSQKYIPPEGSHPFGSILPLTDEFFGPKNLTLLILSKPYQTSETLMTEAVNRIKTNYQKWSKYKVLIWVDMVLALRLTDAGDTDYYDNMQEFAGKVSSFCDQLKDFGVTYMGTLVEPKGANFFQAYIDDFYNQFS